MNFIICFLLLMKQFTSCLYSHFSSQVLKAYLMCYLINPGQALLGIRTK